MPFDGRDIGSVNLIYPNTYHPRAPCVATCAGNALRIAYAVARHHGQMCWQFHYASALTRPDAQRNAQNYQIASGTFGAGWHWLPPQTTHLFGYALFDFLTPQAASEYQARLVVTDGPHTDTGGYQSVYGSAADPNIAHGPTVAGTTVYGGLGPFSDDYPGNAKIRLFVNLSAVPRSQMVRSYIEGTPFPGSANGIIPHYAVVFWACVG